MYFLEDIKICNEKIDDKKQSLLFRSSLMFQIIRKMQYDVHPPTQSKTKVLSMSHRYNNIVRKWIVVCF